MKVRFRIQRRALSGVIGFAVVLLTPTVGLLGAPEFNVLHLHGIVATGEPGVGKLSVQASAVTYKELNNGADNFRVPCTEFIAKARVSLQKNAYGNPGMAISAGRKYDLLAEDSTTRSSFC